MNVLLTLREQKDFTETEEHIKNFILKNDKDIPNMSIYELAEKTYVSTASITRFCHKIGVKSFKELKIKIVSEINAFDKRNINLLNKTEVKEGDSPMIVANKITNTTIQAIEETEMLLSEKDLQKAVDLISKRKQIDLYGIGESAIVAYDASIKFIRINKNVFFSMAETAQRLQSLNSNDEHVAIVISYTGETDAPLEIAKILKNNNTPIISITGNSKNRLVKYADCSLFVSNIESTYRTSAAASRTTSLYLIDILYNACVAADYKNAMIGISRSRVPLKTDKVKK